MKVSKVIYRAEDEAALVADYIRLKLTLVRGGVDMRWTDFDGDSKTMDEREWSVAHGYDAGEGVEADELRVEAFDVEINSHILEVDGRRFRIPLTGALNKATYRFPL